MRIFNLRFSNLNSLVGEWLIDFTKPAYTANGIFAITGPTGSGKSTILDALCLALYGETPRLGKISKSTNEIMARQTGECFAEVEFETACGRFRCHFSQRRARGKASGELQHQKHEIVDVSTGEPIKTKLREVIAKVVEVTGMDFDRFTRSILLAQGGFSKFLLAKAGDRAPILEKITGTEIYSRISMKVHEQTSVERSKLEQMNGDIQAMQLLSPEERQEAEVELEQQAKLGEKLQEESVKLANSLHWLELMGKIKKEISDLDVAMTDFSKKKAESEPKLQSLLLAEKAASMESEYVVLHQIRELQQKDTDLLTQNQKDFSVLRKQQESATENCQDMEGRVREVTEKKERESKLIVEVRALDTMLAEGRKNMEGLMADCRDHQRKRKTMQWEMQKIAVDLQTKEKKLAAINSYFVEQKGDEALVENLEGMRQQLEIVVTLDKKRIKATEVLCQSRQSGGVLLKKQQKKENAYNVAKVEVDACQKSLEEDKAAIRLLLGEWQLPDLRQEVEALGQRQMALTSLATLLEGVNTAKEDIDKFQQEALVLEKRGTETSAIEKLLTEKQQGARETLQHIIEKRDLLHQIRSLEEQRVSLVDDSPCPLCGALSHPYAKGNIPKIDGVNEELQKAELFVENLQKEVAQCTIEYVTIIKDLEQVTHNLQQKKAFVEQEENKVALVFEKLHLDVSEENLTKLVNVELANSEAGLLVAKKTLEKVEKKCQEEQDNQKKLAQAMAKFVDSDKAWEEVKNDLKIQRMEEKRLTKECEALHHEIEEAATAGSDTLKPFGFGSFSPENTAEILLELTRRREVWKENQRGKEIIDQEISCRINDQKTRKILLEKIDNELGEQRCKIKTAALLLHGNMSQRKKLYGTKDPNRQERELLHEFQQVAKALDNAKALLGSLDKQQHALNLAIQGGAESLARRGLELSEREDKWRRSLLGAGLKDEMFFVEIRLEMKEIERLSMLRESLQKEEIELSSQRQDRQKRLREEGVKQLTDRPQGELLQEKETKDEEEKAQQQLIGGLKARLDQDRASRKTQHAKIKRMEAQKKESGRWERLHSLIGSSDGKKFRMFAQGLTFEMMVAHANQKLQAMSDRYILTRSDEAPLELGVIDNYQAGEIRSTKNLSGGESFIVSLALALGLSSMASRNVRVDSLFLDEGFGTLDEEALETALETLSTLHEEGKLIGVISHVPAMKERIATQIQVTPGARGRSTLIGPGCLSC